jgi:BTB/POZ domain
MADQLIAKSNDVKFLVGPEKTEFQANKFVLAYQSSVFRQMFFSDFPSENEIIVPDVDAVAFETMINGISGLAINLDAKNVAGIYYVAEKYDLQLLRQMCKTFVVNSVDSENAVAYLNMFHHYNESEINEKCLSIILDEPLQYFLEPEFLGASADVVRTILRPNNINCSLGDLKVALLDWMANQGLEYKESEWFEAVESHLQISRNQLESKKIRQNLFRKFNYSFTEKTALQTSFRLKAPMLLYGFGLVLGKVAQESIEIHIVSDRDSHNLHDTVIKEGQQDTVSVQDVFWDKIAIYGAELHITITFTNKNETQRACVQSNNKDSFVSYLILSKMPKI